MSDQRFNTGNPIGSDSPLDRSDNTRNLDVLENSRELTEFPDRFGVPRQTRYGMEVAFDADQASRESQFSTAQASRESQFSTAQSSREDQFNTFIASSGYQFVGDYAAGIEITQYNQLVRDENGEFWRVSGQVDLPYVTTGTGIPEDDALVPAGDAVLRQDLSQGVAILAGKTSDAVAKGKSDLTSFSVAQVVREDVIRPEGVALPKPLGVAYGSVVGSVGSTLYTSADGDFWTVASSLPGNASAERPLAIWPTRDGEIIINRNFSLWKSSGWAANPASATFRKVLDVTLFSGSNYQFAAWSVDVQGELILAADYGSPKGVDHNVYLSQDNGDTWDIAFSLEEQSGDLPGYENAHIHGVCIDRFENNRLWVVHGDTPAVRFWYSNDLGQNWVQFENTVKRVTGQTQNVTPIYAMENGIVCGTDGSPNGLILIPRGDLNAVQARRLFAFRDATDFTDVARQMWEGEDGTVYCPFSSFGGALPAKIVAISPDLQVSEVWFDGAFSSSGDGIQVNNAIVFKDYLLSGMSGGTLGTASVLKAKIRRGAPRQYYEADSGWVLGGDGGADNRSLALPASASCGGNRGIAIGHNATVPQNTDSSLVIGEGASAELGQGETSGFGHVVIGYATKVGFSNSIAIGREAFAQLTASIAIGRSASATGGFSIAIGSNAESSSNSNSYGYQSKAGVGGCAWGYQSQAVADRSVAAGYRAVANSSRSVAVGGNAIAEHSDSVALGQGSKTTGGFQVNLGPRGLALSVNSQGAVNPPAGEIRLYVDSSGRLVAAFPNGARKVIADDATPPG